MPEFLEKGRNKSYKEIRLKKKSFECPEELSLKIFPYVYQKMFQQETVIFFEMKIRVTLKEEENEKSKRIDARI